MKTTYRLIAITVCLTMFGLDLILSVITPAIALAQAAAATSEHTVTDAYVYLLGRVLVIRQEHIDLKEPGVAYNVIKYNPLGSADFVNPNLDVAYLEAWFAVDYDAPVVLEVPEIQGRYYTAQLLDEWGTAMDSGDAGWSRHARQEHRSVEVSMVARVLVLTPALLSC